MNLEQLKHAIRAACDVAKDDELIIFGSQAILGSYPNADPDLTQSIEVDACPKNKPENVDMIDGALGEMSSFHKTHGYYVHGVSIDSAKLPEGWKKRTVRVTDYMDKSKMGYCLEIHDLAVSKIIAFRQKDREFVKILILKSMVKADLLLSRLEKTSTEKELIEQAVRWVENVKSEIEEK